MRIKINDSEVYEFKLNEYTESNKEISADKFLELLGRFEKIVKLIKLNKDVKLFKKTKIKRDNVEHKPRTWADTREKALDLLQYYYHGTREDKKRIEKITGTSFYKISKATTGFVKRYNVKPEEIGLNSWEGKIKEKVPNYIIKSYTGLFDE